MAAATESWPSVVGGVEFLLANSSLKFKLFSWVLLPFKSEVKTKWGESPGMECGKEKARNVGRSSAPIL